MDQVSQKCLKSIINLYIFDPTHHVFNHLDLHHLLPQLAENGRDWDSALLSNMLSQPQDLPGGEMRMPNIGVETWNRSGQSHNHLDIDQPESNTYVVLECATTLTSKRWRWCSRRFDNAGDEDDDENGPIALLMVNYDRCDNVVVEEVERRD